MPTLTEPEPSVKHALALPDQPTSAQIVEHARTLSSAQKDAAQQEAAFDLERWQANLRAYQAECRRRRWAY